MKTRPNISRLLGYAFIFLFIPYAPFEPFIGVWIAVKGLPEQV